MSEWMPIETAPKDGTKVLLRSGDRIELGAWSFYLENRIKDPFDLTWLYYLDNRIKDPYYLKDTIQDMIYFGEGDDISISKIYITYQCKVYGWTSGGGHLGMSPSHWSPIPEIP